MLKLVSYFFFSFSFRARRKTAEAKVTVWEPGTGKISVNGEDIRYFELYQAREQVINCYLFYR